MTNPDDNKDSPREEEVPIKEQEESTTTEEPPKEEEEKKEEAEEEEDTKEDAKEETALTMPDDDEKKEEAPPDYSSEEPPKYKAADIGGVIRQAKEDASGKVDFVRRVWVAVFCGVACCGIMIALSLAIPIAMIAIGAIYLKDCDAQRFIPIYLLVGGCFGVLRAIISIGELCRNKKKGISRQKQISETKRPNIIDGIVSCFLFAWFIAGCYWVYSTYGKYQSDDPEGDMYCNEVVYQFAFWLLNCVFILMGLSLLCCCGLFIATCVIGARYRTYDIK